MAKHIMLEKKKGVKSLAYGFEAVARGALEAGVRVVTGFPGNPTNRVIEAFQFLGKRDDLYVEWSTGEKVAFEVAWGASMCGQRAMCSVNMLGTDCLVDALRHAMHHCAGGGLVLLSGDDVGGNTSALEVDTRLIGHMSDMPVLEPADGQEAHDMGRYAFSLSEEVGLPVMLRGVGKVMMSRTGVEVGEIERMERASHFHDPEEDLPFVPGVNFQVISHRLVHEKLAKAGENLAEKDFDRMLPVKGAKVGIIGCGVGYHLAREALSDMGLSDQVSMLKLGVINPLNQSLIAEFLEPLDVVLCMEEGEAFIEERIQAIAKRTGKNARILGKLDGTLISCGELFLPDVVKGIEKTFAAAGLQASSQGLYEPAIPPQAERVLTLCAGCPHIGSFYALREAAKKASQGHYVGVGDVGCAFMGILPPIFTLHTAINMGGAISMATGVAASGVKEPVIAVVGDGGLLHSGISALINAVHNESPIVVMVLDNSVLGNTGLQPTAASEVSVVNEAAPQVDAAELCRGAGVPFLEEVNPLNIEETTGALVRAMAGPKPAVVVAKEPCTLLRLRVEREQKVPEKTGGNQCFGLHRVRKVHGPVMPGNRMGGRTLPAEPQQTCCDAGYLLCLWIVPPVVRSGCYHNERGGKMTKAVDFRLRITGLGGQGVMTIAKVISQAAVNSGLNVTSLDRLRSAMRLGPVHCDICLGGEGFLSTLSHGTADAIIGLEPYEGCMSSGELLRPGGVAIINTFQTPPMTNIAKGSPYPEMDGVWGKLMERDNKLVLVNATDIARSITGKGAGANFVLLGIFLRQVKDFPISKSAICEVIGKDEIKLRCLEAGFEEKVEQQTM